MQSHFFSHYQVGTRLQTYHAFPGNVFPHYSFCYLTTSHYKANILAMKANDSVQELLNPLFSSAIVLFFLLGSMAHHTTTGLFATATCLAPRRAERNVCRRIRRKSLLTNVEM
ncbi:hypothetical protein XENORESO_002844 [Xenotaenia resolanae]|uniref:Uncharacterized protein n=1 Tax=Xenotaenia resolanae TaxID=208358 RepID=A0ABV0X457_9TELE